MAEKKAKKEAVEAIAEPVMQAESKVEKPVDKQAFVARKLRAINDMPNAAKARRLAARVLSNA